MNFKNINWRKIVSELILGSVVGTLLGIFGFLALMIYGGNYGCFYVIDKVFGGQGYESCGLFGLISGILIGSLVSVVLLHRSSFQKESYEKISVISIISIIVIPLIIASVIGLPWVSISLGLIKFLGYSLIPSLLITLFLNRKIFLRKI